MLLRTTSDLAAFVRERRGESGLSQGDLARRAGLRRATIVDLETGQSRPTFETALAVLAALGVGLIVGTVGGATSAGQDAAVDLDELLSEVRRSR